MFPHIAPSLSISILIPRIAPSSPFIALTQASSGISLSPILDARSKFTIECRASFSCGIYPINILIFLDDRKFKDSRVSATIGSPKAVASLSRSACNGRIYCSRAEIFSMCTEGGVSSLKPLNKLKKFV